MNPFMNLFSKFYHSSIFQRIVNFIGSIRKLHHFPWITWDVHLPKVGHDEITEILKLIKPGDVGLHYDEGFLSNIFIPGYFKHAWIHLEDSSLVIEAIKLGVVQRSARYALRTDDLVILRPRVDEEKRIEALGRAKELVGFNYDFAFDFDLKEEFEFLNKFQQAFSCIEVIAYAYYPWFKDLGFMWEQYLGKDVLYPSTLINPSWEVVYSNVPWILTDEQAKKLGIMIPSSV